VLSLSLVFTLLNAFKPLHIDDTAYHYYAAQIAKNPFDPYGFHIFWYEQPEPAIEVLSPPVLPYWWSVAIRVFGDRPFLWKLWLFPFNLVFVYSLNSLLLRFAPGWEARLLVMTILSPAFLPSLNLMLDVPALALGLFALTVFMHSEERSLPSLALASGLVAGLAMQTKYTTCLMPVVFLVHAYLLGKVRYALLAGVAAVLVFTSWEMVIGRLYGESHFFHHLKEADIVSPQRYLLTLQLLNALGALLPGLTFLSLAAVEAKAKTITTVFAATLLGYLAVLCVPERLSAYQWRLGTLSGRVQLESAIFGGLGALTVVAFLLLACRTVRPRWREIVQQRHGIKNSSDWFLIAWLALETMSYFMISPFPAVRRVLGIVVVATLLAGRLLSRMWPVEQRNRLVPAVIFGTLALGFAYYGLDVREACVQKQAAEAAYEQLPKRGGSSVWYVGHWAFQYYAENAGMSPVVPNESQLCRGDWLIIPDKRLNQQSIHLDNNAIELVSTLSFSDPIPLKTVPCFYGEDSPMRHHDGARLTIRIYRVTADFIAEWIPPPPTSDP
jgi:hypothetical protein